MDSALSAPQRDIYCTLMTVSRWAVKEAAYKALSAAYRPVWHELTYTHGPAGRPMLQYQPKEGFPHPANGMEDAVSEMKVGKPSDGLGAPTPRLKALHTSVSHDGEYAIANVLAEGEGEIDACCPWRELNASSYSA